MLGEKIEFRLIDSKLEYKKLREKFIEAFDLLKIYGEIEVRYISLDPQKKETRIFATEEMKDLDKYNQIFRIAEAYKVKNSSVKECESYKFSLENLLKKYIERNQLIFLSDAFCYEERMYYLEIVINTEAYYKHNNSLLNINFIDNLFDRMNREFFKEVSGIDGDDQVYRLEADELIELTTKDYFRDLKLNPSLKYHDIYRLINKLSNMKYEKGIATGEIIIGGLNSVVINNLIRFEKSYSLNKSRKIRKLLEGTNGDYALFTDSKEAYGFISKKVAKSLKEVFKIKIYGSYHWELYYKEVRVLKIVESLPYFDNLSSERLAFLGKLKEVFPRSLNWQNQNMWEIVQGGMRSGKGALLVITDGYLEESKRLGLHATVFNSFLLNDELMENFSRIDGAVIVSPNLECSAMGVILDGMISEGGDSSRGSRYNSAIKYYETLKNKYSMVIVIISEDGSVDVVGGKKQ